MGAADDAFLASGRRNPKPVVRQTVHLCPKRKAPEAFRLRGLGRSGERFDLQAAGNAGQTTRGPLGHYSQVKTLHHSSTSNSVAVSTRTIESIKVIAQIATPYARQRTDGRKMAPYCVAGRCRLLIWNVKMATGAAVG